MKKLTVGSLFAGIGGFDLGLERAGMEIKWQVEIDPFCRKVLEKHWPNVRRYEDVRHCGSKWWADSIMDSMVAWGCGDAPSCPISYHGLESVDVIVGGDPCQRNSNAWRNGGGDESPAAEFVRIIETLRPRIVVRENPSTVRADAPWPWWRFRAELERIGYAVLPFRLRACCVGADHARDRLFVLAALPDADSSGLERAERIVMADQDEGRHHADASGPDRWYATPRVCRGADGIPHRVDRLRGLGNAIVPQIAEWIGKRIIEAEAERLTA